jgi:hypothetical protein
MHDGQVVGEINEALLALIAVPRKMRRRARVFTTHRFT